MNDWEQYEVATLDDRHWGLLGAFPDFDVASALARTRSARIRLTRAVFAGGQRVQEEVLIDVGSTRRA